MATKDIDVNGVVFPCPVEWTVIQAVTNIRSIYVLQGGGIRHDGVPVSESDPRSIGSFAGALAFVGGPIQQPSKDRIVLFLTILSVSFPDTYTF